MSVDDLLAAAQAALFEHDDEGLHHRNGLTFATAEKLRAAIAATKALIAREEQALVDYPQEGNCLLPSIASLEKMARQLEAESGALE